MSNADISLIHRYAGNRDPEAFAALVTTYQQLVFATCRRRLHDAADLDDAVQETFLRLAQNASTIRTNLGSWLHRCATNVSTDLNRRRATRHRHESANPQTPPDIDPQQQLAELREHLDAALAKLSADQRELLIQRYFLNRPQTELAAALHVAPSTLSLRLDRAIAALRRHLHTAPTLAIGTAALAALLESEHAASAVPQSLTANLMKIGLTGVPTAAVGTSLLTKLLALAALLLLTISLTIWKFQRPSESTPRAATPIAASPLEPAPPLPDTPSTTLPSITVTPTTPGQPSQPPNWKSSTAPTTAILAGRILGPAGKPIANAKVSLYGPSHDTTITDADGIYAFDTVSNEGRYTIGVDADGYVSLEPFVSNAPAIELLKSSQARRDIVLDRGVPITISTFDDLGNPIDTSFISISRLSTTQTSDVRTRRKAKGIETALLPVSTTPYLITAEAEAFAPAHVQITPTSSDKPLDVRLSFVPGISVQAVAICADGKPAGGWKLGATPDWWSSNSVAPDFPIDKDGNVTLAHILPGNYQFHLSKPAGDSFSSDETLLALHLPPTSQPLRIAIPGLSPSALGTLTGHLRFLGDRPNGVEITAVSTTNPAQTYMCIATLGPRQSGKTHLNAHQGIFTLANIPRGTYRLTFQSSDLEPKTIDSVQIPGKIDPVDLTAISRPTVTGTITDAADHHPITHLAYRIRKLQTLGDSPNYVDPEAWVQAADPAGQIHAEVLTPGIYQLQISADGYAWLWTSDIRIEDRSGTANFTLALTRGGSIAGTITDPAGKPVANAKVIPLSKAQGTNSTSEGPHFVSDAGSVLTDSQGHFLLTHLAAGDEALKVVADGFAPLIASTVHVNDNQVTTADPAQLHVGGSIDGIVFDTAGNPAPGIALSFQDTPAYVFSDNESGSRIASARTDDHGHYHIDHLPPQLLYVQIPEARDHIAVLQRVVLPRDSVTTHLDFGGTPRVTGRLLNNGAPVAHRTVHLAAGEGMSARSFGPVQCAATTDDQGRFTFFSPPEGSYTLYERMTDQRYTLIPLKPTMITNTTTDLGDVSASFGPTRFILTGAALPEYADLDSVSVEDNRFPERPFQDEIAYAARVPGKIEEWLATDVPGTPAILKLWFPTGLAYSFPFQHSPDAGESTVQINLPSTFATLILPIAPSRTARVGGDWVSHDGHTSLSLWLDPEHPRTLRIPATTYRWKDAPHSTVSLAPGETRHLQIADLPAPPASLSTLELRVFSREGILLTSSKVELVDGTGKLLPSEHNSYLGPTFSVQVGNYIARATLTTGEKISQPIQASGQTTAHPVIVNLFASR